MDEKPVPITAAEPAAQKQPEIEKQPEVDVTPGNFNASAEADEAMRAVMGHTPISLSPEQNKRLLRKIDLHLMPLMCAVYLMNYLDKTTLSYASVMGLQQDAHLTGNQYSWLGSVFYFGYLGFEFPTSRLLQTFPLAKYTATSIILWGAVLACMAAIQNFGGAVTVRLLLGIFEAVVTPGFALMTGRWYTKDEQNTRVNIWFCFNGVAQVVGGVIAYGITVGVQDHGAALAGWRIIFLVTGLATVALGGWFWAVVPDSQLDARWLRGKSEGGDGEKGGEDEIDERAMAVERVRVNGQGIGNRQYKPYQLREAMTDPMTWAFALYALLADIPNGGLTNFFSQLIVSFGYTPAQSLLYGTPGGAVEVISLLASGFLGDYTGQRLLSSGGGQLASLIGVILLLALPRDTNSANIGRLLGYYLTMASPAPFTALLSMVSANVAGYTKKTTVAAIYLVAYCVGNIIGPQTFRQQDAPRYVPGETVIIVCTVICLVDLAVIRWWYGRENRRKAAVRAMPGYQRIENQEFLDLTDKENAEFTYIM